MLALVGNDVVDLGDSEIAEHHARERFVARVCCDEERARLAVAASPKRYLWTLFAAKEAAYKVARKIHGDAIFAHRRFVVAEDLRSVRWGDLELALRVEADDARVHAVTSTEPAPAIAAVAAIWRNEPPSTAGRTLLREALARAHDCTPDEIEVARTELPDSWDGFGPPRVLLRGAPIARDVSLSHDGRFVAFAASR